jgi:hypothetical protein
LDFLLGGKMKAINRLFPVCLFILISLSTNLAVSASDPLTIDPIWCPVGVTPVSGTGGCSPSFTTMTGLLTWLRANDPNAAGVIWIGREYDSAAEGVTGFTLDSSHYARLDNYPLTIQGGWRGLRTVAVDHTDRSVFTGDFLHVYMWNSSVTINDILVDGASESGIDVYASGDMNLSNVDCRNNTGGSGGGVHGASLFNYASGNGNVTVSNSTFNSNRDGGLFITAARAISINNVTANGNGVNGVGAALDNRYGSTRPQPVTFTGTNTFNDNGSGVSVLSKGPIVVHEITASGSSSTATGIGAYFDNHWADSPQLVSVLGRVHAFNSNPGGGMVINSLGAIRAENILAMDNGRWGTVLVNNYEGGRGALTLSGQSLFANNGYSGLNAFSNGTIALFGVSTVRNAWDGIWMSTPSSASINCAKIYSNGEYGVDASDVSRSFTLSDVTFDLANSLGEYSYSGTATITTGGCLMRDGMRSGAPMEIISYVPQSLITLDCNNYGGTQLNYPAWRAIFHCPTLGDVIIWPTDVNSLPIPLPDPDKQTFISGFTLSLKEKEIEQSLTTGLTTLSFMLPKGAQGQSYSVLYWTGKEWVDLQLAGFQDGRIVFDGGTLTEDGSIAVSVNFTGTFVLVSQ